MQSTAPVHHATPPAATPPGAAAPPPADAGGAATAWLHIHAVATTVPGTSRVRRLWQQVCTLGTAAGPHGSGRLDVEVRDLGGARVLAIDDASPTIVLSLPAGTYHVVALQCGRRRQFTVALRPGSVVELQLRAQPEPARG